ARGASRGAGAARYSAAPPPEPGPPGARPGPRGGVQAMELVGRKLGMTQIYDDEGGQIPVTVLAIGPCVVVQKKTAETDGYSALQLGFEERKEKHVSQPLRGHFAKAGVPLRRVLFETRLPEADA